MYNTRPEGPGVREMLETEMAYYHKISDELIGKAKGEYALIHDESLIDTFRSKDDAIKKGYELFGNTPFLVKKIIEMDIPIHFTSTLIAVPAR